MGRSIQRSPPPYCNSLGTGHSIGVTLKWTASRGATSYEYCVDSSNNKTCNATWISIGNRTNAALSGLTLGQHYYWQVRARNSNGYTYANGGATAWWSFTIAYGYRDMTVGFVQVGSEGLWSDANTYSFYETAANLGIKVKFYGNEASGATSCGFSQFHYGS